MEHADVLIYHKYIIKIFLNIKGFKINSRILKIEWCLIMDSWNKIFS